VGQSTEKIKGLMVFYVNFYPDLGQEVEPVMQMIKEMNAPLITRLAEEVRYLCLFVPTTKESTRIEKVDFDYPFPRCVAGSADVEREGVIIKKKKPSEEESKGFITLYVNFHPEFPLNPKEIISLIQKFNQEVLKQIAEDSRYQFMFVPTTKESSRVEKIDYNDPFPRFVPKSMRNTLALMPKEEDEEIEENEI